MAALHSDSRITFLLRHADLVGLTHVGRDGEDTCLPGFVCVRALTRPHSTKDGGLALFARQHMADRVTVVRERAAMGMLWVRVQHPQGGRPLFVGLCYVPPEGSATYRSGPDMPSHWQALDQDVMEFQAEGRVMLMGDFNARTGAGAADIDTGEAWDEAEAHTGVPPPAEVLALRGMAGGLPRRANLDSGVNRMGRCLLRMCRERRLLVLNGRLPGTESDGFTFQNHRGRSTVDYMLASPELAFARSGAVLPGCCFSVLEGGDIHRLPPRPGMGEGRFDHFPISAAVRWGPGGGEGRGPGGGEGGPSGGEPGAVRMSWRDGLQGPWTELLCSEGATTWWGQVQAAGSVDEAVAAFDAGFMSAVGELHARCGRVVRFGGGRPGRPANGWFDDGCRDARRALRLAEGQHGCGSEQAREARRLYRRELRRAQQAFQDREREEMVAWLYDDPKSFWRKYQAKACAADAAGDLGAWTAHFRQVLEGNKAGTYVGGSVEAHCTHFDYLFPRPDQVGEARRQAAAALNERFTDGELQVAIARLLRHRAAGVDGVPAEFFNQAYSQVEGPDGKPMRYYVLGPVLARLFTAVLQGGYPDAWRTSALAPVPKPKGRPDLRDDYRGIAVSAVVAKLFSLCLQQRMDKWAEEGGLRAQGQAGFRGGKGTADNCFVLRHMVDAAGVGQRPLYAAFIDFSKAYDRVDRSLLWKVLEGYGMHGEALGVLRSMHANVCMRVRLGGKLGEPFEALAGVKQGDPLSPLLFGIYIDRLEGWLTRECPAAGAALGGRLLRVLFYADDVVLLSDTPGGLQSLLDALDRFCQANSMFVNAKKSEVVVFHSKHHRGPWPQFSCGRDVLERVPGYTYLGLGFLDGQPLKGQLQRAVAKARAAMQGMFGQCYKLSMHNANVQGHLFDALVKPVLCYGCEVWGPDWALTACGNGKLCTGPAESQVHQVFMRQSLGVAKSTPSAVVMQELNRSPLMCFWVRMAAQLWNRAVKEESSWLAVALKAGLDLAWHSGLGTAQCRGLWAFQFVTCMEHLGLPWCGAGGELRALDLTAVKRALADKWQAFEWGAVNDAAACSWAAEPLAVRAVPASFRQGFSHLVYRQWFAADKWVRKETWTYHLQRYDQIRAIAQYRTGSHWLAVRTGRWHNKPRHARVCPHCKDVMEDELHLFECPLYGELRAQHGMASGPIGSDGMFRDQMNVTTRREWEDMANFLLGCRELRERIFPASAP